MAFNFSEISKVSSFKAIQEGFDSYIVRPLNAFGFGGFVFDIEGSTEVNLQADITDHYVENNVAIQDHIAVKPVKITLKNYVGELVYREDDSDNNPLQEVTRKLTVVNNYLPQLTQGAQQLKDLYNKNFDDEFKKVSGDSYKLPSLEETVNLWALVKNLSPPVPRQAQAYMFFEAMFQQKLLMSVQTPYKFFTNMAIETITAKQGENSKFISDFTITLKQIRKAETLAAQAGSVKASQGRNGDQGVEEKIIAKTQGQEVDSSTLFNLVGSSSEGISGMIEGLQPVVFANEAEVIQQ